MRQSRFFDCGYAIFDLDDVLCISRESNHAGCYEVSLNDDFKIILLADDGERLIKQWVDYFS